MNFIRSGQLLAPFGIGQVVNLPKNISMMIGGLNLWDEAFENRRITGGALFTFSKDEFEVYEPRLSNRLLGMRLFKPYDWRKTGKVNTQIPIYGVRFPGWHYCNSCRIMQQMSLNNASALDCVKCGGKETMIPVRFVAVCSKGHIEDVPFMKWVHRGDPDQSKPHQLRYYEKAGAGDLGDIIISCSCSKSMRRSLAGITRVNALNNPSVDDSSDDHENGNSNNPSCNGYKPWTGKIEPSLCSENLQVVLKGASNVHYSKLISSIYIPDNNQKREIADSVIQRIGIDSIMSIYDQDRENKIILKLVLQTQQEVLGGTIQIDDLLEEIERRINGSEDENDEIQSETFFRRQEYDVFTGSDINHNELITKKIDQFIDFYNNQILTDNFESIVLIEKLRETIAFTGFTRLNPENDLTLKERMELLSNDEIKWLPAYVVHGEGILFQFKKEKIKKWIDYLKINNIQIEKHIDRFKNYQRLLNSENANREIDYAFIMIHTFAHLMIKRLCYNCGYGSSSLKERIYYSNELGSEMYGVLIYTASSDSEGSLGGLVNQGRQNFLSKNISEALEDASWCSADPVCMEVGINSGQGPGSSNGAACHNCAIISETSCEEFNLLLDRSTIVGSIEHPSNGYFYNHF